MNLINFSQLGGFPMNQQILGKLQTAFSLFNSLGAIAGDKAIISGCVLTGTTVSDGTVYVNGEVLEFRGGTQQAAVIVREIATALVFENNNSYPVIKTRFVQFGVGENSIPWAEFKRGFPTKDVNSLADRIAKLEKKTAVFTAGGGMVEWRKPAIDIPDGWHEVVDWRGRLAIGVDPNQVEFATVGHPGGSKVHTLTIAQLPEVKPKGAAGFKKGGQLGGGIGVTRNDSDGGTFGENELVAPFGGGESHPIMNPYRTVYFIEYIES